MATDKAAQQQLKDAIEDELAQAIRKVLRRYGQLPYADGRYMPQFAAEEFAAAHHRSKSQLSADR